MLKSKNPQYLFSCLLYWKLNFFYKKLMKLLTVIQKEKKTNVIEFAYKEMHNLKNMDNSKKNA